MNPTLIALIASTLLLLAWAVVMSDRELIKDEKRKRVKHYDNHGHE
jgi:hypothetical protein